MNIHSPATSLDALVRSLRRDPDALALSASGVHLTRREFADRISVTQQVLRAQGLAPGVPFALLSSQRLETVITQYAAQLTGARMTVISPRASVDDIVYTMEDAGIGMLIIDADTFGHYVVQLRERLPHLHTVCTIGETKLPNTVSIEEHAAKLSPQQLVAPDVEWDAVSSVAYTGGTTGAPKGVQGSYRSAATLTQLQLSHWDWPDSPVTLVCTPLSHAGGTMVLPTLLLGGRVVVLERFTPEAFADIVERERINTVMLVPTMLYTILGSAECTPKRLASLETVMYGAAPMRPESMRQALERFGKIFMQFYGQTECGMAIAVKRRNEHTLTPEGLQRTGRPVPWMDVAIMGPDGTILPRGVRGEIVVRGPLVMQGYLGNPEATREAFAHGYLHTGDVGVVDEEGFLTIVDRMKDMIVSGGFNVYPSEVEAVLAEQEDTRALVVGVPDAYWGEKVVALVERDNPKEMPEAEVHSFREHVRARKGDVYVPKHIFAVAALPKTALGKYDRVAATRLAQQLVTAYKSSSDSVVGEGSPKSPNAL